MVNVAGCPVGAFFIATVTTTLPPGSLLALTDWMLFNPSGAGACWALAPKAQTERITAANWIMP
jgi:hypothetical protein